jgi:endonuclease YncB( thermonuclease family)
MKLIGAAALTLAMAALSTNEISAGETIPGPVPAKDLRVIGGDMNEVTARIWLGKSVHIRVRLEGVDTPELRG